MAAHSLNCNNIEELCQEHWVDDAVGSRDHDTKMMVCKFEWKRDITSEGLGVVVCGVHGFSETKALETTTAFGKKWWDKLASHIEYHGVQFLGGDFSMPLDQVIPQLQTRGITASSCTWSPWLHKRAPKLGSGLRVAVFRLSFWNIDHVGLVLTAEISRQQRPDWWNATHGKNTRSKRIGNGKDNHDNGPAPPGLHKCGANDTPAPCTQRMYANNWGGAPAEEATPESKSGSTIEQLRDDRNLSRKQNKPDSIIDRKPDPINERWLDDRMQNRKTVRNAYDRHVNLDTKKNRIVETISSSQRVHNIPDRDTRRRRRHGTNFTMARNVGHDVHMLNRNRACGATMLQLAECRTTAVAAMANGGWNVTLRSGLAMKTSGSGIVRMVEIT